ncbi:MAG: FadR/GntR family transcriptional regulator [Sciscionella sp.]
MNGAARQRGNSGQPPEAETPETSQLFSRISVGRVSAVIVDQIRLVIRQGQLRPGDRLPAERELCERFGVSRVTVREALRVLESNGLIDIRVGARGGAFVTAPSRDRVGEGLTDLLLLSALNPADVTEVRFILELGIVQAVCERATDEDISELRSICHDARAALARSEYSMALSATFHVRVAESTHNPAVVMLVESFRGALLMSLEAAHNRAPEMGRLGVDEHESFVDAVAARDAKLARRIMREHLTRTASRIRLARK